MHRFAAIVLASALLLGGCRHNPSDEDRTDPGTKAHASQEEDLQESSSQFGLEEDVLYIVSADSDSAFVRIDAISRNTLSGTCFVLDRLSNVAVPSPLEVHFFRKHCDLRIGRKEYGLQLRKRHIQTILNGRRHNIRFDQNRQISFKVERYEPPLFRDTSDSRYCRESYHVKVEKDIPYATARGYWTSLTGNEDQSYGRIAMSGLKGSIRQKDLTLTLDRYSPQELGSEPHPLVLFIHGGAFYVGDKSDPAIAQWCSHFARLGYEAASINYRMGFKPSNNEIHRTIYMAAQDAHAAMRFLLCTDTAHAIDPDQLFIAGTSAGAITALNLAYMTNRDRSESTYRPRRRFRDLGNLESSGNEYHKYFQFRAVANLWGAVEDVDIMKGSHTHIISVHGDADQVVPYDQGYPFNDMGEWLGKKLFGTMYGSAAITRQAERQGLRCRLVTLPGAGHAPHLDEERRIIPKIHQMIQDSVQDFFYHTMVPSVPYLAHPEPRSRRYTIEGDALSEVTWQAEGGVILGCDDLHADIVWLGHPGTPHASGRHDCGKWFRL